MSALSPRLRFAGQFLVLLALATEPIAAQRLVFSDNFSDRHRGWPVSDPSRPAVGGLFHYLSSGIYQITPLQAGGYAVARPPVANYGPDVSVETDVDLVTTTSESFVGVACRFQDANNFYGFALAGTGNFVIVKVRNREWIVLRRGPSTSRGYGAQRIRGECAGDRLEMYVNGAQVAGISDNSFSRGYVGLLVGGSRSSSASGAFEHFELREIGDSGFRDTARDRDFDAPPLRPSPPPPTPSPSSGAAYDQAVAQVEYRGFVHESVIGWKHGYRLISQRTLSPLGSFQVLVNPGGDGYSLVLKRDSSYTSGIAGWDIEVNRASGRVTCRRNPLFDGALGHLRLSNSAGEVICER
jgi:hypothetical protein